MPQFPLEYEILLVLVVFTFAFLLFKKRFKLNSKSMAFKVILYMTIGNAILISAAIITMGYLNNEFIIVLCVI